MCGRPNQLIPQGLDNLVDGGIKGSVAMQQSPFLCVLSPSVRFSRCRVGVGGSHLPCSENLAIARGWRRGSGLSSRGGHGFSNRESYSYTLSGIYIFKAFRRA